MEYNTILVSKKEHIATITLNRPESLNTFSLEMALELDAALWEADRDDDVYVVILKGAGKGFCAGIDVNLMKGHTATELYWFTGPTQEASLTMSRMVKPVIASVHKIAVANGAGLVASADLAVAARNTKFGTTAVNVGLFCMGPAIPLSKSVGRKKALELLFTGDIIDAEEALRIGLINQVVDDDKLEEETWKLAKKIAAKSPLGVQMGKRTFYATADLEYSKAYDMANGQFAILGSTEDASEGIDAFLNRREPRFKLK